MKKLYNIDFEIILNDNKSPFFRIAQIADDPAEAAELAIKAAQKFEDYYRPGAYIHILDIKHIKDLDLQ